ncbi:hypothetical protein JCM1393_23880 [Clostridium carnis]
MLSNLLGNVKVTNKLFTLNDSKIIKITSENVKLEEVNDIFSKYDGKKFKKIIVKAFSLQPNLNGYGIIAKERKEDLKNGLSKIKLLTGVSEVKFVVDGKDKGLQKELSSISEVIKVKSIDDLYNNKLIYKVFGKEQSEDEVLIEDLIELIQLGQADKNIPREILVTVYGSAINGNKVVSLNLGTTYRELFTLLNGTDINLNKVIDGGSLNGTPIYNLDKEIEMSSKGILYLTENNSKREENFSCIRCAKCLRACPEGLNPIKLMELYRINEKDEFIKFGGEKCIDCGLCSFVCPSNIDIAQSIKTAKTFK